MIFKPRDNLFCVEGLNSYRQTSCHLYKGYTINEFLKSLSLTKKINLYKFEALLFVRWNSCFEKYGVCPVLSVQQRIVAVQTGKLVDTSMTFLNMKIVLYIIVL